MECLKCRGTTGELKWYVSLKERCRIETILLRRKKKVGRDNLNNNIVFLILIQCLVCQKEICCTLCQCRRTSYFMF